MSEVPLPKSVSVGLSHEASRGDQSTRVSIKITAETDAAPLAKRGELQQQLSRQAQTALERQVCHMAATDPLATGTIAGPTPLSPRSRRPRL